MCRGGLRISHFLSGLGHFATKTMIQIKVENNNNIEYEILVG